MSFVVDSSVALSWCFEDERTPATRALLELVGEAGALVPQHWPAEVLNGLMMADRRRQQRCGDPEQPDKCAMLPVVHPTGRQWPPPRAKSPSS